MYAGDFQNCYECHVLRVRDVAYDAVTGDGSDAAGSDVEIASL